MSDIMECVPAVSIEANHVLWNTAIVYTVHGVGKILYVVYHHHHNALRDLGLMACSDLIFKNPIVFSVDVPGFFSLMVGSSG
jgi:hypothetical protein